MTMWAIRVIRCVQAFPRIHPTPAARGEMTRAAVGMRELHLMLFFWKQPIFRPRLT
jgi:hypothetical protein